MHFSVARKNEINQKYFEVKLKTKHLNSQSIILPISKLKFQQSTVMKCIHIRNGPSKGVQMTAHVSISILHEFPQSWSLQKSVVMGENS